MSYYIENTTKEIFKPIPGYEHGYEVSNLGRVKSLKYNNTNKEKSLKERRNKYGYLYVDLCKDGKSIKKTIHRIVMLAFVGESDLQVNHINGIKSDNRLENLEYCTASENSIHAFKIGLRRTHKGEKHGASKLTNACVERIKYGHQGMKQKDIAKIYGINDKQVRNIRSGRHWAHI